MGGRATDTRFCSLLPEIRERDTDSFVVNRLHFRPVLFTTTRESAKEVVRICRRSRAFCLGAAKVDYPVKVIVDGVLVRPRGSFVARRKRFDTDLEHLQAQASRWEMFK